MSDHHSIEFWDEVNGGFRGSSLLRAGAVLSVPASLLNLASQFLPQYGTEVVGWVVTVAWLLWIASLSFLAAGFMWVGIQPFFSRFGWVVGAFYLFNALYLVIVLFARYRLPIPGVSLAVGRTLILLFFATVEKESMRRSLYVGLVVVTVLQFLKITLRTYGLGAEMPPALQTGLDGLVVTLMAIMLFLVAGDIRRAENDWAENIYSQRGMGLADFNNPMHSWNRED